MDLHAWITQQVDRVETAALAETEGRRVTFVPNSGSHAVTGTITAASYGADGLSLTIDQHGPIQVEGLPAPLQPAAAALRRCEADLRRCEADRRILARHAPQPDGTGFPDGRQCRTCSESGGDGYQYLLPYPCPTIMDLAHARGITTQPIATSDAPAALRGPTGSPDTGARAMVAEITAPVEVATCLPGATPIGGRIGNLAVALRGDTLYAEDVYRALGALLVEAGNYIIDNAALPNPGIDD